jgi:hypothetical protein
VVPVIEWTVKSHAPASADGVEWKRAEVVTVDTKSWLKLEAFPTRSRKMNQWKEQPQIAVADQLERIEGINQRVRGWAYSIPEFKAELISKRKDNLLKPLEKK